MSKSVAGIDSSSLSSPWGGAERACLLDVQVVTIEEVFAGRAADIDARVFGGRPEDQQAEQTDGESTLQVAAVWDTTRVQQLVAMVISQGSGLLGVVQMFPEEPHNCLDLKHTRNPMNNIHLLTVDNVVRLIRDRLL